MESPVRNEMSASIAAQPLLKDRKTSRRPRAGRVLYRSRFLTPELELRKFQVNRSFESILGRIERPVRGCPGF